MGERRRVDALFRIIEQEIVERDMHRGEAAGIGRECVGDAMRQYLGAMGAERFQSRGNRCLSHVSLPFGAFSASVRTPTISDRSDVGKPDGIQAFPLSDLSLSVSPVKSGSSPIHMPPVLQLRDIRLTLGGHPLLDGAELAVAPRERIALVGRNGSGKSTLLKIAAGDIEPDGGSRFAQPGASLRYLAQEPDLSAFDTVLDFVLDGLGEEDDPYRARALMEELGVDPAARPSSLSGGEARRAALVRALAPAPEILLLDEPTNHLDLLAIEWLEKELAQTRSAFVLISHDKRLLANLTRATVWLDRGATRRLEQGFAAFEAWRDLQLEEEEIERHKLDRRIVMEEHWLRYGVTARRKRNMRRVGELGEMRKERREARRVQGEVKMAASDAAPSGKLVIEADRLSKSYGERAIVKDFSIRVARGDRLGIIGANGAGKTTLVNLITGVLAADSGAIRLGASLEMATLDQRRASLEPTTTWWTP